MSSLDPRAVGRAVLRAAPGGRGRLWAQAAVIRHTVRWLCCELPRPLLDGGPGCRAGSLHEAVHEAPARSQETWL